MHLVIQLPKIEKAAKRENEIRSKSYPGGITRNRIGKGALGL